MEFILRMYIDLPPFTKYFSTSCILLSLAVNLEFLTRFDVYYNPKSIVEKYEIWRLITPFLYIGPFDFGFLLNILFAYRYCNYMEETTFQNRPLDLGVLFIYGWISILIFGYLTTTIFLNEAFTFMMIYIWARINPFMHVNFLGIVLPANYIPAVLLLFTFTFTNSYEDELIGFISGHFYYYFEFVFPALPFSRGFKLFQPWVWGSKIINAIRIRYAERKNRSKTKTTTKEVVSQTLSQRIPNDDAAPSVTPDTDSSDSNTQLYDTWSLPVFNEKDNAKTSSHRYSSSIKNQNEESDPIEGENGDDDNQPQKSING